MQSRRSRSISDCSVIVFIGLIGSLVTIFVFITGKSNLAEFIDSLKSPQPEKLQINPPSTPNANIIQITDLIGVDKTIIQHKVANLDGAGPDEIIVSWQNNDAFNHFDDKALDIFSYLENQGWKKVLHLPEMSVPCPNLPDFGVVNLFENQTRQIVIWTGCGSSSHLFLEIYVYRGLGSAERIYSNNVDDEKWFESVPSVNNNGELFIFHSDGLYKYTWENNGLVGAPIQIDPGSNGVILEFASTVTCSEENVRDITLSVDQFLYLKYVKKEDQNNFPVRVRYLDNGVLEMRNPLLFYARSPGTSYVEIWGCEAPLANITVTSP